jgi:hypothetical protein
LAQILGAGTELVSSDDNAQDTLDRERFVQKYQEMHRLVRDPGGVAVLHVGAENWPFPIPSSRVTEYGDSIRMAGRKKSGFGGSARTK